MRWSRCLPAACCAAMLSSPATAQELSCPQLGVGLDLPVVTASPDEIILTADQADIDQDGLSRLAGQVRLVQGANQFETQALRYDEQARAVQVEAESLFRNEDLVIHSRTAAFDLDDRSGTFNDTTFTLLARSARGAAERIHLSATGDAAVEDVYYTTCAPESRAWVLEASSIELDPAEGLGTATHARLRFGYIPVLYAPWFRFPLDDRRRTGFLFPVLGESDTTGADLRIPFYINLAPNYDLQLTPRYMSRRGTQVASEGRYLTEGHTGRVRWEYLDEDELTNAERSYVNFRHVGLLNRRLGMNLRYAEVSDINYFEDLSSRLDAASITHLERSARLSYAAPAAYTITARVADYQTVSRSVLPQNDPYKRLPELRLQASTRNDLLDTRLGIVGQYVNFVRDRPPEGQRLELIPFLRYQRDEHAWFASAQVDWRWAQYQVTDPVSGQATGPARSLPVFSLDGGLRFERITDDGELQTLEPRLYYLYVPFEDQSRLPIFDTGEPDFDFVQLFERNRFSGEDRISDANHLAAAFTSRLLDPDDGIVRVSASVGQIYRFTAPRLMVPSLSSETPDRGGTDYIAGMDWRLARDWHVDGALQWSPDSAEVQRSSVGLRYQGEQRRLRLAYRYRGQLASTAEKLEQADASMLTPIAFGWSLLGRVRYSLPNDRTLEALGGLEYQTCCWAVRGAWRRYQFTFNDAAQEPEYTTGLYLQVELRGLARIGAGFEDLLPLLD